MKVDIKDYITGSYTRQYQYKSSRNRLIRRCLMSDREFEETSLSRRHWLQIYLGKCSPELKQ